jgi:two-component system sensor histidine kinase CpxA
MAGRIETLLTAERRLLLDISHELHLRWPPRGGHRAGALRRRARWRAQPDTEGRRLNSLVGQLLQVTRAEGDPASLRRDPVRLDELVRQLVDDSSIEAASHHCRLQYRTARPVTVAGDAELLRRWRRDPQRAILHAPPDTASNKLARETDAWPVDIRDHGTGVPEEALPRLFDAFYRVETDRNRNQGGIGLGLSIARRAIELHKGAIRARNAGTGLEVELELPATADAAAAASCLARPSPGSPDRVMAADIGEEWFMAPQLHGWID